MENRIDRKDDRSLYQPKIHERSIKELYELKQVTGKPLTVLLDQAIREFSECHKTQNLEEPAMEELKEKTWEELCEYRKLLDELELLCCKDRLS